jgi:hypothetical protein
MGTTYYASVIVHEAVHVKLYRDAMRRSWFGFVRWYEYGGVEAERKCCAVQLEVLIALRAPQKVLDCFHNAVESPDRLDVPKSSWEAVIRTWKFRLFGKY